MALEGSTSGVREGCGRILGWLGLILSSSALALGCGLFVFKRLWNRSNLLHLVALCLLVLSPFAASFVSSVVPDENQRSVRAARTECQALIQYIESHRRATGSCPKTIEPWLTGFDARALPLGVEYHHDASGERYRLGFSEDVGDASGFPLHVYDSERAAWFSFDSTFDFSFERDRLAYWLGEDGG